MVKLSDNELKNILAKLIIKSMSNPEPAKEIVEQAMSDSDFKEQIRLLCQEYMKPKFRDSYLLAKSVDIRTLSTLIDVCQREKVGIIPIDFSGEYGHIYDKNDKISVLILSGQLQEFDKLLLEASAISGTVVEMKRSLSDLFGKKLKDANPLIEIKGVKKNTYEAMKRNMSKLPYDMRFTMFPKEAESNKVNVGFFTKTNPVIMKKGHSKETSGPYLIPKIASVLLASALLERPDMEKKYEKLKKRNMQLMNEITDMYYSSDNPYYLVPAIVGKDNYNVFMDQAFYVDYYESVNMGVMDYFISTKFSGLNHTIVPMTKNEYELFKNEVIINPNIIDFYKNNLMPLYADPEQMLDKEVSESLIEMLNRKREQIMLMSDDFNGNNLVNLDNYIVSTVHEIITREDEDFTDWLEVDEKIDTREMELLSDLEDAYSMVAVNAPHDKLSELINKERADLEAFRSKASEHEDPSL